jgi:hypothetical protein
MADRSTVAVVFTQSILSRKKGRHYGESHQKALQISVRRLPLVGMSSRREGAKFLPGFRTKRKAWHPWMNAVAAFWVGECFASHTMAVQEGI